MDMKSQFNTQNEWEDYRNEIRRGFRKLLIVGKDGHKKFQEATNIINKIDWRFTEISKLKVKIRQDHKEALHQEYIDMFYNEIHELVKVLNENFVLEILLGD